MAFAVGLPGPSSKPRAHRLVCSASSLPEGPSPPDPQRRKALKSALALAMASLVGPSSSAAMSGDAPPAASSVANSVLSAYGLPQLKDAKGMSIINSQFGRTAVEFQAPRSWVVQRNALPVPDEGELLGSVARVTFAGSTSEIPEGRASPLTAGDYRRAEGVAFHVLSGFSEESVKDISPITVANLVVPNDTTGKPEDAKLVRGSDKMLDEIRRSLDFKFETVTTSGYFVERHTRVVFSVQGGKLFALAGTASAPRWKKLEEAGTWNTIMNSFHVALL